MGTGVEGEDELLACSVVPPSLVDKPPSVVSPAPVEVSSATEVVSPAPVVVSSATEVVSSGTVVVSSAVVGNRVVSSVEINVTNVNIV